MQPLPRYGKYISRTSLVLLGIVLLGIFLRSYHFRDWLYFYPDQARDLLLARDVIEGHASLPLLGPIAASSPFRLGPIYYYFQIIAGELFGVRPETMAYPDLFFGVLSIPLLFYVLRRYFTSYLSLLLTGLYSVSYFAIRYARFAWNTNPIPFFSMLFLLSLLEFLDEKEKTKWPWAMALGIALGVGIQLHTLLLILMPATLAGVFVYFLWKRIFLWDKWALVIVLVLLLNIGPLVSEQSTHFHNTRYFWHTLTDRSPQGGNGLMKNVVLDIVCHAQANTHLLTSFDNKDYCDTFNDLDIAAKHRAGIVFSVITLGSLSFGVCLLVLSIIFWRYFLRRETDPKKKQFLVLMAFYFGLSFFVIFPVIDDNAPMRYFLPTIFMPLVSLGLILQYLIVRFPVKGRWIVLSIILLFGMLNIISIGREASVFVKNAQSRSNYIVLGELEQMRDYILSWSGGQPEIYFMGEQKFYQNYTKSFGFVFEEKGVTIIKVRDIDMLVPGKPLFYIADEGEGFLAYGIAGHPIESERHIGQVIVYMLKNE